MSFILIPKNGEDIQINAWNWRPTIELLRQAKLISDDLWDAMGANGRGASVDADMAGHIAAYLDQRLQSMKPADRMRADLSITSIPKKGFVITPTTKVEQIDAVEAYSATYEWLAQFRDFCRSSGGFKIS
jgi:hypothetical protein